MLLILQFVAESLAFASPGFLLCGSHRHRFRHFSSHTAILTSLPKENHVIFFDFLFIFGYFLYKLHEWFISNLFNIANFYNHPFGTLTGF